MKLFPSTFLALRVIEVAFVTTCCCCILKNVSASHASPPSSMTKEQDPTNYDHRDNANNNIISIIHGNHRILHPERYNVTSSIGLSPNNNDDQWVQLGDTMKGKAIADFFGYSIAVSKSGDSVIIGGLYNDDNGKDSGYAQIYHYDKDSEKWEKVGGDILGEKAGDRSGVSVDMNDTGDMVIIGSHYNDDQAGHARVFRLIDGQWYKQGQDIIGGAGNQFGLSVAMSNNGKRVLVGGPNGANGRGYVKAYAYNADIQRWEQLGLYIEGEASGDQSGWSVDMDDTGDTIIIGARYNDGNGSSAGHARIYRFIDGQWVQKGQDLDGKNKGDTFGWSVAITGDGEKVIIGGPLHDVDEIDSAGYAQVYEYKDDNDTEIWEQVGGDISGENTKDELGRSVGINRAGNVVIVGAPSKDGNGVGRARVYRLINTQWVMQGQDLDGILTGDRFGFDVAISGNGEKVMIGAPYNDANGKIDAGHVRAFIFNKPPTAPPSSMPTAASFCTDSPLKVITVADKGIKSARSCDFIAARREKFCWMKEIKTHCPYACDDCERYRSSDSKGSFVFEEDVVTDCKWLRKSNVIKVSKLCENDSINATCRKTCGLFAQKCDCCDNEQIE